MILQRVSAFFSNRKRHWTLVFGCLFISIWTVTRSITNGVNYDVVGQIGVVNQWLHGMHDGTQLGATNYLLKMPLYALVNYLGFLSPQHKLLTLALICNLVTFIAIVLICEKILKLYSIRPTGWFYLGLVWMAAISGRIFWLDYANSRNLEVAAGLLVFYLGLKLYHDVLNSSRNNSSIKNLATRHWLSLLSFTGIAGIVFFADQLQLYTIGLGLVLHYAVTSVRSRGKQLASCIAVIAGVIGAAVISKIILLVTTILLPVTYLSAPRGTAALTISTVIEAIRNTVHGTARLFDVSLYATTSAPNLIRQAGNLLLLIGAITLIGRYRQNLRTGNLWLAAGSCIVAAYVVYLFGGQALVAGTERYLIMVPFLFILILAQAVPVKPTGRLNGTMLVTVGLLMMSGLLVIGGLIVNWPNRYRKDAYIPATLNYLDQHGYERAIGTRNGIPLTYFAASSKPGSSAPSAVIIPVICTPDHRLVFSNLFFDVAPFNALAALSGRPKQSEPVPLITPSNGVTSNGSTCSPADIERQFGRPLRQQSIDNVGDIRVYNAANVVRNITRNTGKT